MNRRHLIGVGGRLGLGAGPEDERRDHITRPGRIVVESAEEVEVTQSDLLLDLAPSSFLRRLALVDAAARERPLARVGAHPLRSAGQDEGRAAGRAVDRAAEPMAGRKPGHHVESVRALVFWK